MNTPLRSFKTLEGERLLEEIAAQKDLSSSTLASIKSFLSGAFRFARRKGILNSENPMRDVVLPKGRAAANTFAYSLDEIGRMLDSLPDPAATSVAVAAYTGIRKGELRGLLWENYTGAEIRITQSVWGSQVQPPKTKASFAPVPVIPRLAERLGAYRAAQGQPESGLLFPNGAGKPMSLDRLVTDVIRPALKKPRIEWHGWHAFRRGLVSNLSRMGLQDKVIQAILRHANVAVTQRCYIKTADPDAVKAMMELERGLNMPQTCTSSSRSEEQPIVIH